MFAHARAPVRIGIAGGGTDLPAWTRERVGRCLSLAIKMYTYAVAITRFDGQVVASYSGRDVDRSATEIGNGLIRESALHFGLENGFEVHTISELSSRGSGLGVSSSIAVALAACFRRLAYGDCLFRDEALFGDSGDARYSTNTARDAWTVEIDKLRRPIGRQDHMAAAHGGLRLYSFSGNGAEVERSFSAEDAAWVAEHVLLVQLPEGHDVRAILSGVKSADALRDAMGAVAVAERAIAERDPTWLGDAFARGHASKCAIAGAVPPWLAEVVGRVYAVAGVYGCKVAGAGGGGHVVAACEPTARAAIEAATGLPVFAVEPDLEGVRSGRWA